MLVTRCPAPLCYKSASALEMRLGMGTMALIAAFILNEHARDIIPVYPVRVLAQPGRPPKAGTGNDCAQHVSARRVAGPVALRALPLPW